jgi:hypothetical protein
MRRLGARHSIAPIALLAACGLLVACAGMPVDPGDAKGGAPGDDGIGRLVDAVAPLATQCTFVSGTMTVKVDAGETALITKRASDSAILANGEVCNDGSAGGRGVAPNVTVTSSTIKKLAVAEGTTGVQSVVIDFGNGVYAPSTGQAGTGITVDLGGDAGDGLVVNGTALADTVTIGALGISVNDAAHLSITLGHAIDDLTFALGDGDDKFSSGGDTVAGGAGNGVFVPSGTLTVYGGNGNDTFLQGKVPTPGEKIVGGAGTDKIDYSGRTAGVRVSLGLGAGADDGDPTYGAGAGEKDDVAGDVEWLLGGSGADTLSAGLASCGTATGCVTLNGGAGDDWFDQGTILSAGEQIIGGAGIDTVDYSGRTNALTITMDGTKVDDGEASENDGIAADVERLFGGAGNDSITGNSMPNTLSGGAGADTLHGLDGEDVFVMAAWNHAGATWSTGADGADVVFGDNGLDRADYSPRAAGVKATLHDGTLADPYVGDSGATGELDDLRVENLRGAAGGGNVLTGNGGTNDLRGGTGADTLLGGAGDDFLDGGGGSGADTFVCGAGFDVTMNVGSGSPARPADCEV